MAWVTPRTWPSGHIVLAAELNQDIRDNELDLYNRLNMAPQLVQQTIATLDAQGSLVLAATTTVVLLETTAPANVTGCSIPLRTPWQLDVVNVSAHTITLLHEDVTLQSNPSKRFYLPASGSLVMGLGNAIRFLYISVPAGARWVSMVHG